MADPSRRCSYHHEDWYTEVRTKSELVHTCGKIKEDEKSHPSHPSYICKLDEEPCRTYNELPKTYVDPKSETAKIELDPSELPTQKDIKSVKRLSTAEKIKKRSQDLQHTIKVLKEVDKNGAHLA